MADETAGIGDKVKKGWELVKPNIVTWIIALIVGGLMSCFLLGGIAQAGWTIMVIKSRNGEKIEVGDMFKGFERFVDYFVIGIVAVIPLVGFITPWAMYYCVDKKADFMTSLKWSLAFFLKNLVPCIIAFVVAIILIIIGEIACGIGVFITAPIAMFYLFDTYVGLEKNTAAGEKPEMPKT
ncbi:MAG: hypothetical protein K8T20_15435 [Planctomycetes bacterium]|nr:hypothetical protein [Planctomycetota bacterium]